MSRYITIKCSQETYYDGYSEPELEIIGSVDNIEHALGRARNTLASSAAVKVLDCEKGYFIDRDRYTLDEDGYIRYSTYEENASANWDESSSDYRPAVEMDKIIAEREKAKAE